MHEGETVYVYVSNPTGAELDALPDGAQQVDVDDQTYWYANGTFYQPIRREGKDLYVVVDPPPGAVVPELPEDVMEDTEADMTVYQYDETYFTEATEEESPSGGYVVQPSPPEESLDDVPEDATSFEVDEVFYYYVDNALYVALDEGGYGASEPPLGGIAPVLPDGATVITEGGDTYFQFDTVFFVMKTQDGENVYEVIAAPDGSEVVEG